MITIEIVEIPQSHLINACLSYCDSSFISFSLIFDIENLTLIKRCIDNGECINNGVLDSRPTLNSYVISLSVHIFSKQFIEKMELMTLNVRFLRRFKNINSDFFVNLLNPTR